ncbi:MAG TPA: CdaR family protein, partial [Anaerolineales bacterium]|nr:CdaR family protein [Anaerolineales bacterium]
MRWLIRNLSALTLSLALAVTIWVVAVTEEDPFEEKQFPAEIPIIINNLPEGAMIVGNPRLTASLQIRAPLSVWSSLTADQLHLQANLPDDASGTITVPITFVVDDRNARITNIVPDSIQITLEQIVTREIPVRLQITGEPATGYKLGEAVSAPSAVTLSGPASAADSVSELVVSLDVSGAKQPVAETVSLTPVDASGQAVVGVSLSPNVVTVSIPVEQLGGYRDVAVKAVIEGQVAPGFRISTISISPLVVTLFSADPTVVAGLPGFVETETIDIDKASDDVEVRANLVLPEGVSIVGEQTALVQISIAAIESSITIQHDLDIVGLGLGLNAVTSPTTVDVILSGPLPTLESLTPDSVRVLID